MEASKKIEAAKRPNSAALVWVEHPSFVDNDGDPVVIQVPITQLAAHIAQGYKAMNIAKVEAAKEPAVKPKGVKSADDELEQIEEETETVNETETDNGKGRKVDSSQQKDGLPVSSRGRGGKG